MNFNSYDTILEFDYKTAEEITLALNALESMYSYGNISEYQYKNAIVLLKDKLKLL